MNATYFRIVRWVTEEENKVKENGKGSVEAVILDMSSKFCKLGYIQIPTRNSVFDSQ
jgi:hypothetical protein